MDEQEPNTDQQENLKKAQKPASVGDMPKEYGGFADQNKPEPTRYGDWEVGGRCSDF